ncbi:MAG TPA: Uma2 family endonuclease [Thermoanaerobaculia bacterium]|nr:Uma2 family endonuclease [Thermoanaerobaculia bacterium]
MSTMPLAQEVYYPESDGRPMAETEVHGQVMIDLWNALRRRYASVPDVYAWGNMFLYYQQGNPSACVAPDLFLVHGVDKRVRRTYKLWEEGRVPSLIIEVTSKSTRDEDEVEKKGIYERLGVEEYFLFDPLGEYLRPQLQGYRRVGGRYQALAPEADGSLASRTTGLRLAPEGERLRLRDAATGEPLLWSEEQAEAQQAAEEHARAAEERAGQEARRAEREAQRADQEMRARQSAEERIRQLEEELARRNPSSR